MRLTFEMLLKIISLVIMGSIVVESRCPPPEVVSPCSCIESSYSLICIKLNSDDFNSTYNLTHIFENISKNLNKGDAIEDPLEGQPFKLLMIANTQTLTFEESLFSSITFEKLFVMENNLTKIHSKIFEKTYSSVKEVYMNLNSVKDNQQNYSLFEALSSLENLEVLQMDFGINSITSIPENAFNSGKGVQQNLIEVSLNGRIQSIGQLAFAQLPNLRILRVLNEIQTLGPHSFAFESSSSNELQIDLSSNRLTATSFEDGTLSNIGRPVSLILAQNKIKYLDESVFMSFLEANKNNNVVLTKNPLNCTDCRSYWLLKQITSLKDRITDPVCVSGKSMWDHQWDQQCNDHTVDKTNGSSFLSLNPSLILLFFVIFKFI